MATHYGRSCPHPHFPRPAPLPTQGGFMADSAVAFVDIPRDEACVPSTCIQVGGAAPPRPHPPAPVPDLFPCHQPTGELLPPKAPLQAVALGDTGGVQGGGRRLTELPPLGLQGWRTDVHFSTPQQLCDLQCSECRAWASTLGVRGQWTLTGRRKPGLDPILSSEPVAGSHSQGGGSVRCSGDRVPVGDRGATCLGVRPGF